MSYKEDARIARRKVLEMVHRAQTSHIGSNFSCIDLLTVLFERMKLRPDDPNEGDRIVFSKGWAAASAYYFLSKAGYIPEEDLDKFPNPPYLGLAEDSVQGVETAGGSMGHGLPVAVGMALGYKRSGNPRKVFVLMSDGEMDCGTTWESALLAAHHKLDNLIVICDYNKWQAMGRTNEVVNLEPLEKKWKAFNWRTTRIDGHDHMSIQLAISNTKYRVGKPHLIVADTIKGKGVSFMEDHLLYHYKNIDDKEYKKALKELI